MTTNEFNKKVDDLIEDHNLFIPYDDLEQNPWELHIDIKDDDRISIMFDLNGKKAVSFSFYTDRLEDVYDYIWYVLKEINKVSL